MYIAYIGSQTARLGQGTGTLFPSSFSLLDVDVGMTSAWTLPYQISGTAKSIFLPKACYCCYSLSTFRPLHVISVSLSRASLVGVNIIDVHLIEYISQERISYEKKNATDVWKQLKSSFAVSGFASVEQDILKIHELHHSSCKSLQDFLNRLIIAKERLEAQSVHLPTVVLYGQLLRGSRPMVTDWQ